MFQSINWPEQDEYLGILYKLTDSDFVAIAFIGHNRYVGNGSNENCELLAVYQEYSKRKLNVAANLVLYFQWCEKEYGESIASGIAGLNSLIDYLDAPKIKEEIQKYL